MNKDVRLLIAEDDDGHAELITEALRESGVLNEIKRFRDGQELLDYLEESRKESPWPVPGGAGYLLLLDINMPRLDGVETLSRLKGDDAFREIPVIMLTTADDPREVERCYRLGCNIYVTKPVKFPQFVETLRRLGLFIQIVRA